MYEEKSPASTPEEVLHFWFGELIDDEVPWDKAPAWFQKDAAFDEEVCARFGDLLEQAASGTLDGWAETARGRLALILLCDQLTRNAYRDAARMYALDDKALALVLEGLERGMLETLRPIERTFFIMPTMHAEDTQVQRRCVELFNQLADEASPKNRDYFVRSADYAERHRAIVERFGRFPHRNTILGRASTAAERAFLEEPGSSF